MISDADIQKKAWASGTRDGITLMLEKQVFLLSRYEAFRFSRFLENAILESCRLSGKKVDEEFAG